MATPSVPGHHNSTPVRPTPVKAYWLSQNFGGSYQSAKVDKMKTLTHFLMEENKSYQHANVDIIQFAEHTWALGRSDGEKLLDLEISLDSVSLKAYKNASHETKLHRPFVDFADQLLQAALDIMEPVSVDEPPSEPIDGSDPSLGSSGSPTPTTTSRSASLENAVTNIFWDGNGSKPLKQHGRSRKPDMLLLFSRLSKGETPQWTSVKHIIEFKNDAKEKPLPSLPGIAPRRPGKGRRALSMASLPKKVESSTSTTMVSSTTVHTGKKRTRDAAKDSSDGELPKENPKKPRTDGLLAERHFQLAGYATEALASTCRIWVVGLIIDVCKVNVCYFDRFLIARAASFDFESEPQKLALVLYCMHKCNLRQAGFDTHLRPWSSLLPPSTVTEEMEVKLSQPVKRIEDSFLEYPLDQDSRKLLESILFPPEPDSTKPLDSDASTESESPSEGDTTPEPTTTLPSDSNGTLSMRIAEVIRTPDSDLICRGTAVYKVKIQLPGGGETEESYAYKLSWPLKKRVSEVEIIRKLREVLPLESRKHLPEIFFSHTAYPQDLSLPWLNFGLPLNGTNYEDRVQRGIGFKLYGALWEAGSIDNFQKAWLDCVEVHHLAYKMGKVLHRDISENNIMVTLDADGSVIGVLNDWDMAKLVDSTDDGLTAGKHRTASSPFVALELLAGTPSPHFLRHDLESFFWILVWAALHYNLKIGTRDSQVHALFQQAVESSTGNVSWKRAVFSPFSTFIRELAAAAKPEFKEMCSRTGFIGVIHRLCYQCGMHWEDELTSKGLPEGTTSDTYGGRFTFKEFMKQIGQEPRNWGIPKFLDE